MNGQYNYNQGFQDVKKPMWAAVTSFVLSIVNIVFCCCAAFVLAPLSIVFGIVSLAKKWAGKGLAVAGIVISSLSLVLMVISVILTNTVFSEFKEPYMDMMKFAMNADKYIEEYQETGEVPEDFQKYRDPKYDEWWENSGYENFDEFFDNFMKGFMDSYNQYDYDNDVNDDDRFFDDDGDRDFFDDYGEKPVEL